VLIYSYLCPFKSNVLKTKVTLLFIILGFSFSSFFCLAQKERKKKPDPVFSSARMAEAERIFTEGEKFFILEDYTKALFVTHYLHVVAVFQIVGGLLLLIGRFVPLGLVLLAPVIVNIDLVHILMDPSGLPMAAVISILLVFLIWRYRDAFKGILSP